MSNIAVHRTHQIIMFVINLEIDATTILSEHFIKELLFQDCPQILQERGHRDPEPACHFDPISTGSNVTHIAFR